jgi:hypothetical protein
MKKIALLLLAVITFTASGTLSCTGSFAAQALVVGGGGGGSGAGGGAGGSGIVIISCATILCGP